MSLKGKERDGEPLGKDDLDALPFRAMKASVYWKRQLPFYVAAFESTCVKRAAHSEPFLLPSLGGFRPASAQSPFPPGGTCCDSLALAQRDTFLSRFLAECSRDPSGGCQKAWSLLGQRCPCWGHGGEPRLLQLFLHPGAEQWGALDRTSRAWRGPAA